MRQFRLKGPASTIVIWAHSSLDAGARWKSDPNFYSIGELLEIEDLGNGKVKVYKKPRPIKPTKEPATVQMRKPVVRSVFSFALLKETA